MKRLAALVFPTLLVFALTLAFAPVSHTEATVTLMHPTAHDTVPIQPQEELQYDGERDWFILSSTGTIYMKDAQPKDAGKSMDAFIPNNAWVPTE